LKRGDTNYKLFSLRQNTVLDFNKIIRLDHDDFGRP